MMQSRELFRKLALACGSATLLAAALVPGGQASGAAGVPSLGKATTTVVTAPGPTPPPTPGHKNHTVTNPAPPGPGAPQPGVKPLAPPSLLSSTLAAAGIAAPSSSLPASPCTFTSTCDLWAKAGTLSLPDPLVPTLPVWGFATSRNGLAQVPGPVLIANVGQTISIRVHNELPNNTAGGNNALSLEVPASSAQTDLTGIDSGEQQTYNFGKLRPGTYLYEAGPTPDGARQVRMGLSGILIVRPSNFAACNCAYAYGSADTGAFVDESTLLLNEFDPAFNTDPFNFDPVEFSPTEFTINGHAFDNSAVGALNAINVISGDVLLLHYANLSDHERGITISNERQKILADDSYVLANPGDVATKWLNPGQVSDSFVTIDPSFPKDARIPVYDSGLHLSNGADLGLGGMFTYLYVSQSLAGSSNGPVTTVALDASTNSGIEPLTVSGNVTAAPGATLTDAEWFLDHPGTPGSGTTCPTGGLALSSPGSGYISPSVTFSGPGTGAAATVTGSLDKINVTAGGAGYTHPTAAVSGASVTASGSVDAVKVLPTGSHYSTPKVTFSGGGGSGATATATGSVDGVNLPTPGAGYTLPVVTLSGGGAITGATVSVSGGVDGFKIVAAGSGYKAPIVGFTGGGGDGLAAANALFDPNSGVITGFTITNHGSGYTSAPIVSITDATPGVIGANISSTISVAVINLGPGGSGYSSAPAIAITDSNGGTGAPVTATATISVTGVTNLVGGAGYTTAPAVGIADVLPGTGHDALATATLTITAITIDPGGAGSGYNPAPDVSITDPGGSGGGASAKSTLTLKSTLTQNAITLTNPGSGYRTTPTVSIGDVPGGGAGAQATASIPAADTLCIYQHLTINPDGTFNFPIHSVDLNYLVMNSLTKDGDHIIWVHAKDSNGNWGVVAGDVFTYNKTGPVVGGLSVHASPTNGLRPTDVANGGGAIDPITLVKQNAPSNDLVILGMASASLSNFVVTGAEYCIDSMLPLCPPNPILPKDPNPLGPTALVLTPGGSDTNTLPIDAYGHPLLTPTACVPVPSPPGVTPPSLGGAPGGGSIVSFCGIVPQDMLKTGLSEGPHTLYIHACEQLSSSTTPCAQGTPRWGAFSTDASIKFVIDKHGPATTAISIDPNPNNGHLSNQGNLNFLDSLQVAATLSDASTGNSNIAYAEVFVTCSPASLATPSCPSVNGPIDPATNATPADGSGAEMIPSGAAWDSPIKVAFAYIPLAVLTAYPEGYVRFWVHAQDQAGNFGPWISADSADLKFDKTPPVFDSPALPTPTSAPNTVACSTVTVCTIDFKASDPLHGGVRSNIVQVEWFIDQGAQVICEANVPGCTPEVAVLSDPGYGSATPGTFATTVPDTTRSGTITLGQQAVGTKIVFRVKDEAGNWSLDNLVVTT